MQTFWKKTPNNLYISSNILFFIQLNFLFDILKWVEVKFFKLPIHLQKLGSHFPRCFILMLILPHFFQKSKPFSIKIFTHKLSRIFKFWKARLQVSRKLKNFRNLSWFFLHIKFWKNGFRLHSKTHFIRKNKVTILRFKDYIL